MKYLLFTALFLWSVLCNAQIILEENVFNNLVAIGVLFSNNINAKGRAFEKSLDSLRTPKLNHIVDALIEVGKGQKSIMETRFLERPDNEELYFWYVIREIHYNRQGETGESRPDAVVAKEVLSENIDERWLLDNYYFQIHSGFASLFNDADLSKYDINLENLGFKNKTEKAIFFLDIVNAMVGGRFLVFLKTENNKAIIEFAERLPKFNGNEYFYYKDFDYDDFEWIGYEETESYNERHIGNFYSTLVAHFNAAADLLGKTEAQEIYYNSIMYEPEFFKYTGYGEDLQSIYNQVNGLTEPEDKPASILQFDSRYIECEDKWVAFPKNDDGTYPYGFIYIDSEAGLTLNYEGTFTISGEGIFKPQKFDSTNVKVRLEPNQNKVAVIPPDKFEELQVQEYPDWLKYYKTDTASIARLYRWGFLYNSWGECAKALTYLERAEKIDPNYNGLNVELAYAYNDLQQYDKAIAAAQAAIDADTNDCFGYKELSFAEVHSGQLEKASETSRKGISVCSDEQIKAEIAYGLARQYYKMNDKADFKYWAGITKKWAKNGDTFMDNIKQMESEIDK